MYFQLLYLSIFRIYCISMLLYQLAAGLEGAEPAVVVEGGSYSGGGFSLECRVLGAERTKQKNIAEE